MKEVFKCREWRVMRWDKVWTKAQDWGCPCHAKKYPRGTSVKAWGCPRGTPFSLAKIRSPFNTLYFYCFIFYAFFLERLYFCFLFYFVFFAAINGWTPTNFFWRRHTSFFIANNTLFSLLSFNECSLFLVLRLAFVFCLDLCSDLVISLHQGVFRPLVYVGFHQKSCFKKVWMVLEKRKKFMPKVVQKGSLFRLRLRLLHAMIDIALIVCLVVFAVAWLVSNDWDCLMSLCNKNVIFIIWEHVIVVFSLMLYLGWLGACLQHVWL
jgi:hypothetical protein